MKTIKAWAIIKGKKCKEFGFGQLGVFKRSTKKGLVECGINKYKDEKVVKVEIKILK